MGMKIRNDYTNGISFRAGLTREVLTAIRETDIKAAEKAFAQDLGVDANFQNSKFYTFAFQKVAGMFADMCKRFDLPFSSTPPQIRVYNSENRVFDFIPENFCIYSENQVLKNESLFQPGAIFVKNRDDVQKINHEYDWMFERGERCSPHFLSDVIHEWVHSLHVRNVCNNEYYQKLLARKKDKAFRDYDSFKLDRDVKRQVAKSLGRYATFFDSKTELIAEGVTKLVTDVLNPESFLVERNPLDNINSIPAVVRKLIQKEFTI